MELGSSDDKGSHATNASLDIHSHVMIISSLSDYSSQYMLFQERKKGWELNPKPQMTPLYSSFQFFHYPNISPTIYPYVAPM